MDLYFSPLACSLATRISLYEAGADADPVALGYLATATLHTLAIRSRAGLPRKELDALAAAAVNVICGTPR